MRTNFSSLWINWLKCQYRISSYSFRGNYSFLNLEIQTSQYIRPKVTVHKCAETIQGRKSYEEIRYVLLDEKNNIKLIKKPIQFKIVLKLVKIPSSNFCKIWSEQLNGFYFAKRKKVLEKCCFINSRRNHKLTSTLRLLITKRRNSMKFESQNNWWRFRKILWPSQNIWTLNTH